MKNLRVVLMVVLGFTILGIAGIANAETITGDLTVTEWIYGKLWAMGEVTPNQTFDLGRSTYNWGNLWLASNAYIAGNVGIGTTSLTEKLTIDGSDIAFLMRNGGSDRFQIRTSETQGKIDIWANYPVGFRGASSYVFSGNVGIGTTSPPTAELDVVGDIVSNDVYVLLDLTDDNVNNPVLTSIAEVLETLQAQVDTIGTLNTTITNLTNRVTAIENALSKPGASGDARWGK